jgi:hypothetical protein
LEPLLSPLGYWNSVPPKATQETLRQLFQKWGLPERVRLDNGHPWGSSTDLPPALALWLLGLGIGVIHNPPRTPQKNGCVERFHGLAEPWAEPEQCASVEAYQQRLDWVVRVQRELYPSISTSNEKQSRLHAYPTLAEVARPYDPSREEHTWDLERVKGYLAGGLWRRKVNKVGQVSIYRRALTVGHSYRSREVLVTFDPKTSEWLIQAANGDELARHQASEITAEKVCDLAVSNRPNSHQLVPNTTSRQTT